MWGGGAVIELTPPPPPEKLSDEAHLSIFGIIIFAHSWFVTSPPPPPDHVQETLGVGQTDTHTHQKYGLVRKA